MIATLSGVVGTHPIAAVAALMIMAVALFGVGIYLTLR